MFGLPPFRDTHFIPAEKIFFTDRIIERVFLWMIPEWILPNHITLFRMIATPFTVQLLYDHHYGFGIPVFLFVALTDALDGALARTRNKITPWGMMFDPLADKLLIVPSVAVLIFSTLNSVLGVSIIIIEALIVLLALLWRREGRVIQANVWGKVKMCAQVTGIVSLLFGVWAGMPFFLHFASITLAGSIAFGIVSIIRHGI